MTRKPNQKIMEIWLARKTVSIAVETKSNRLWRTWWIAFSGKNQDTGKVDKRSRNRTVVEQIQEQSVRPAEDFKVVTADCSCLLWICQVPSQR
jgi:hypothetical protein